MVEKIKMFIYPNSKEFRRTKIVGNTIFRTTYEINVGFMQLLCQINTEPARSFLMTLEPASEETACKM